MGYLKGYLLILPENLSKDLEEQSYQKTTCYLKYYLFLNIENKKPEELPGKTRPRTWLENLNNFHYW